MGSLRSFRKRQVEPLTIPKPSDAEFIAAVHVGSVKKVTDLLQRGANPNAVDTDSTPALHYAAYNGKFQMIQILMEYGADVNHLDSQRNTTLNLAISSGSKVAEKICIWLLDHGAAVNAADHLGRTPLMYAVVYDLFDLAKLLVEMGAARCQLHLCIDDNYTCAC
jgi:uncharacterized protein